MLYLPIITVNVLSLFFQIYIIKCVENNKHSFLTGPRSAVGNVSGYRCVSDCNSRGREFDPGPVQ